MKRYLSLFVAVLLGGTAYTQDELPGHRDTVLQGAPEGQIMRLGALLDTSSLLRSSPVRLARFLDTLENAARKKDDTGPLLAFIAYRRMVSPTTWEKDSSKRIAIYEQALDEYTERGDKRFQAVCLHYIGQERFVAGNYGEAFEYALQSQALFRQMGLGHIPEIGKYLHDLALNYYYFRDYEKVRELMHESLRYLPYNDNLDIQRYNTLALSYQRLGKPDSAEYYFRRTVERAAYFQDSTWIANASGNLASIHMERGDYRAAVPLLLVDFNHNRRNTLFPEMARNAALSLAEAWLALGKADSARHFLRESEKIQRREVAGNRFGRQQRDEQFLQLYYRVLHRYHAQLGDHKRAYQYLDSMTSATKELDARYHVMVATAAENRLKIQQHLAAMELAKQERHTANVRWVLAISVLAMISVILGLAYYLYRHKAARQRVEAELKEAHMRMEQERIDAAFRQAKAELKHQLELLEEKNTLVEQLESELEILRQQVDLPADVLDAAIRRLSETRLLTHHDWVSFRRQFNLVFDASLDHLKAEHPDLTQAEERVYALNQLGVDTRQMAAALGISPESVRKARYRLKKKLANGG